jgi:carbonic anhydrase/acetyltransferase-like protein (isoleucine patch superfamily)
MVVSKGYCASNGFSAIGYDVLIAHDAVVMAGANVATGAAVERNAVVTKDAGPFRLWSESSKCGSSVILSNENCSFVTQPLVRIACAGT